MQKLHIYTVVNMYFYIDKIIYNIAFVYFFSSRSLPFAQQMIYEIKRFFIDKTGIRISSQPPFLSLSLAPSPSVHLSICSFAFLCQCVQCEYILRFERFAVVRPPKHANTHTYAWCGFADSIWLAI